MNKPEWMMTWDDVRTLYGSLPMSAMSNIEERIANAAQRKLLKYLVTESDSNYQNSEAYVYEFRKMLKQLESGKGTLISTVHKENPPKS